VKRDRSHLRVVPDLPPDEDVAPDPVVRSEPAEDPGWWECPTCHNRIDRAGDRCTRRWCLGANAYSSYREHSPAEMEIKHAKPGRFPTPPPPWGPASG